MKYLFIHLELSETIKDQQSKKIRKRNSSISSNEKSKNYQSILIVEFEFVFYYFNS